MKTRLDLLTAFCDETPMKHYDSSRPFRQGGCVYFASSTGAVRLNEDFAFADPQELATIDLTAALSPETTSHPPVDALPVWTAAGRFIDRAALSVAADPTSVQGMRYVTATPCGNCNGLGLIETSTPCPTCRGDGRHRCGCEFCKEPCTHCKGDRLVDGRSITCGDCLGTGAAAGFIGGWPFDWKQIKKVRALPAVDSIALVEVDGGSALRFTFEEGDGFVNGWSGEAVKDSSIREVKLGT